MFFLIGCVCMFIPGIMSMVPQLIESIITKLGRMRKITDYWLIILSLLTFVIISILCGFFLNLIFSEQETKDGIQYVWSCFVSISLGGLGLLFSSQYIKAFGKDSFVKYIQEYLISRVGMDEQFVYKHALIFSNCPGFTLFIEHIENQCRSKNYYMPNWTVLKEFTHKRLWRLSFIERFLFIHNVMESSRLLCQEIIFEYCVDVYGINPKTFNDVRDYVLDTFPTELDESVYRPIDSFVWFNNYQISELQSLFCKAIDFVKYQPTSMYHNIKADWFTYRNEIQKFMYDVLQGNLDQPQVEIRLLEYEFFERRTESC